MKFLLLLLLSLSVNAQNSAGSSSGSLTLYVEPSPMGLDWSSPLKLLGSIQLNRLTFKKRPLGVVYSELICGEERDVYTSYYQELDLFEGLVQRGQGLGILAHSFKGKFERGESLQSELAGKLADEKLQFIRFLLSPGHCQRLKNFIAEYEAKNVGKLWGLPHRPLLGEGGTSIALAMALLEVLGFNDTIYQEGWMNSVLLPSKLAGPPLSDEQISPLSLISASWAASKDPHRVLSFWDKEKMHQWIVRNLKSFPQTRIGNTTGILIDRRHFPVLKHPAWRPQPDLELPRNK